MFWLNECDRCEGDLYWDRDVYGSYKTCIQCGHVIDLDERELTPRSVDIAAAEREMPAAAAL